MRMRSGAIGALLLLATCTEEHPGDTPGSRLESAHAALGNVPPTEVATWTRVGPTVQGPDQRYLQSAAFDDNRKVLMMFGGFPGENSAAGLPGLRDLWEWDPATFTWTNRTPAGNKPNMRGGAGMVFDSARNNLVIFGGCSDVGNGYVDFADIWEWNPKTGAFSDRTNSDQGPGFRSEQGMVFEKSTGKVLLFGGALANTAGQEGYDRTVALGDTWEWDPVQGEWKQLQPSSAPSARYDSALVWDSQRSLAVLFGGMEKPQAGLMGVPKQDIWEWDPATQNWSERTTTGLKPSSRYGHAMAYDPGRGVTVLVGGWDIANTNETWEYKVTDLGNGEGCAAATASSCASGFCVEGVCCGVAACSGACQSCSVAGHEGTCVRAAPGTEVPGSCAGGQACDGNGNCKAKNGLACGSASACASGFCVDGVCCENACDGTCVSCNQAGRAGKCSAYAVGSDPENECGVGSDPCRLICNGAGACDAPQSGTPCGPCGFCDGTGTCASPDPSPCGTVTGGVGGTGGVASAGTGGRGGAGGAAGSVASSTSGFGGSATGGAGGTGGTTTTGGAGGAVASGGAGGSASSGGGASGRGGAGGVGGSRDGGGDSIPPDAGSPDGSRDSIGPEAGGAAQLHRAGCDCTHRVRAGVSPWPSVLPLARPTCSAVRATSTRSSTRPGSGTGVPGR